mgnify:CR=1 FL=1
MNQSRVASQSVRSEAFTMKVHIDAAGKSADVDAQGGMILKGDGAGNFFVTMATNVPGTGSQMNVVMVKKGRSVTMQANGETDADTTLAIDEHLLHSRDVGFQIL